MKENIRWMINTDTAQVLDIHTLTDGGAALTEQEFRSLVRESNIIVMVYEEKGKVLGFIVYELYKYYSSLLMLQVHPAYRDRGIGTELLNKLVKKMINHNERKFIATQIRESDLDRLLWAKKKGFFAKSINKSSYTSPDEDGIFMVYDTNKLKGLQSVENEEITLKV